MSYMLSSHTAVSEELVSARLLQLPTELLIDITAALESGHLESSTGRVASLCALRL